MTDFTAANTKILTTVKNKEKIKPPKKWEFPLMVSIVAVIVIGFVVFTKSLIFWTFTPLSFNTTVNFEHRDKIIHTSVSAEDAKRIKNILNFKGLYSDMPSCGLTEKVSVNLDNYTYCFACNGHEIVYYQNFDRYLTLSKDEVNEIHTILAKYGFYFPCV